MNSSHARFTAQHPAPAIDAPLYQRGAGGDFSRLGRSATVAKSPSPHAKVPLALAVNKRASAWVSGLPLSQRGNEGDLATFAWASVSEIPPAPPFKKGGTFAPTPTPANAHRAFANVGYSTPVTVAVIPMGDWQ